MKSYIVFFLCKSQVIKLSSKTFDIDSGLYAYLGSCGKACASRISRHMIRSISKKRWHVDYLDCEPLSAIIFDCPEHEMGVALSNLEHVKSFGNSDDPNVPRLFRITDMPIFLNYVIVVCAKIKYNNA
ncbi:hypothetical protein [Thermoplasma volcanium GSS1]|uniref:GIY-YIG domain-containing protein n=1 Tax=Thermoplasma volcanium (strain ATCC 51530 / DSM 4299 / JCM 9571 / NBRC 15438 / GSS1) TaxID=273116 RepID=Q979V2_THEVO|nr:DUF123 domain-containing protein [Thermoplasma volcanium]BAB60200.1 hypothetical protein [Thermoplasma volcanium GSS1]